jgi:serine/threonine protein kinase
VTCHLDLKLDNIFLTSVGAGSRYQRVVIGDFGCSISKSNIVRGEASKRHQPMGNDLFQPPEGWKGDMPPSYGPETDVWATGAIIRAMAIFLELPHRARLESSAPVGRNFDPELILVVSKMCRRDWRQRPSAARVVGMMEHIRRRLRF